MISGYITHLDWDKLVKLLDDPDIICPSCSNQVDCTGKHECFNRENYKYISIRVDRTKFWGQHPRPPKNKGGFTSRAGDHGLSQLYQIDIQVEESDQSQTERSDLLSEVDS